MSPTALLRGHLRRWSTVAAADAAADDDRQRSDDDDDTGGRPGARMSSETASPPLTSTGALATSWRQALHRPAAALSTWFDAKRTSSPPTQLERRSRADDAHLAALEGPESFSEDDSEVSIDAAQATELLFSAQTDFIDHEYREAVKKLEKSARFGNSAACAYLANVLTHGLDCEEHDHQETKVDVDPQAAARWSIRGLEIEVGKSREPASRRPSADGPGASERRSHGDDISTPSATPSETGPFDLQAATDCASTLTLLFRTRRVRVTADGSPGDKGKQIALHQLAMRIGRLMLEHDGVRLATAASETTTSADDEKLRKMINIHLHYLVALLSVETDHPKEAETAWRRVTAIGHQGPIGDHIADELVGNARRRLILLQNQRRDSEALAATTSSAGEPRAPGMVRRSSTPGHRRHSDSGGRARALFELGAETPTVIDARPSSTSLLAPPSPRSAHSARRKSTAATAARLAGPPKAGARLAFRKLSCIFAGTARTPPVAAPTVAVEAGTAILPPQEKLRSRTSTVSMVHDPLPSDRNDAVSVLRRDCSAASLPNLTRPPAKRSDSAHSASRFPRLRQWIDEAATTTTPPPVDAADALREALRKYDAFITYDEVDESAEDRTTSPVKQLSTAPAASRTRSPRFQIKGLDPTLAKLEDASRVNVMSVCAVCDAKGVNFPRCPRCQQTYCSRACRIGGGGDGERHVCRTPGANSPIETTAD